MRASTELWLTGFTDRYLHVTPLRNLSSIMEFGLEPRAEGRMGRQYERAIYLTTHPMAAWDLAYQFKRASGALESYVILEIDARCVRGIEDDPRAVKEHGVLSRHAIGPECIKVFEVIPASHLRSESFLRAKDERFAGLRMSSRPGERAIPREVRLRGREKGATMTRDNPPETVDAAYIAQLLRDTNADREKGWAELLIDQVRAYPSWKLICVDPNDLDSSRLHFEDDSDIEVLEGMREQGVESFAPIVLVPAAGGEYEWDIVDGAHRAALARDVRKKLWAYVPATAESPQRYLYHCTPANNLRQIAREGLRPSTRTHWGGYLGEESVGKIFASDTPEKSLYYCLILTRDWLQDEHSAPYPALLRIPFGSQWAPDRQGTQVSKFVNGDLVTRRAIPASEIEIMWQRRWQPLTQQLAEKLYDKAYRRSDAGDSYEDDEGAEYEDVNAVLDDVWRMYRLRGRRSVAANPAPAHFWGRAGAGILFHCVADDTYLLTLRSSEVEQPGTWGVPGGACGGEGFFSDGEGRAVPTDAARQCALREAEEELGHVPRQFREREYIVYQKGNFAYTTFVLDVTAAQKRAMSERAELNWENDDVDWFALDDMREMGDKLHFGVQYVLKALGGR